MSPLDGMIGDVPKVAKRYHDLAAVKRAVKDDCARWYKDTFGPEFRAPAPADRSVERRARVHFDRLRAAFLEVMKFMDEVNRAVNGQCSAYMVEELLPRLGAEPQFDVRWQWRPIRESRAFVAADAMPIFDKMAGRKLTPTERARLSILFGGWPDAMTGARVKLGATVADVIGAERRNVAQAERRTGARPKRGTPKTRPRVP